MTKVSKLEEGSGGLQVRGQSGLHNEIQLYRSKANKQDKTYHCFSDARDSAFEYTIVALISLPFIFWLGLPLTRIFLACLSPYFIGI